MKCSKCGSTDVVVSFVQTKEQSRTKKPGFTRTLIRWTMIAMTFGAWTMTKKKQGVTTTKVKSRRVAVCQDCGASWNV